MTLEYVTMPVTTAADGTATVYSLPISGEVDQVSYTPDGSVPLDAATTIALTTEQTGITIASHGSLGTTAFTRAYRAPVYQTDGTAALYAAGGKPLLAPIAVAGERLKLVISGGGNAKKGTFNIHFRR